jgi:hypothetical protein
MMIFQYNYHTNLNQPLTHAHPAKLVLAILASHMANGGGEEHERQFHKKDT